MSYLRRDISRRTAPTHNGLIPRFYTATMSDRNKFMNRTILRIALPSIAQNVTVPLLGLADAAISGHLGGAQYIGAVAVGAMIFNMLYWLCAFLRMSTGGLTAQAIGRQDDPAPALLRALRIAMFISLLLLLLQIPLGNVAFRLMEATPTVEKLARTYYRVLIWGAPAVLSTYVLNGWFLGRQDARTPMLVAITQNLLNIGLSLFFVLVMDWKVEGVASGTLIAQWVGVAMYLLATVPRHKSPSPSSTAIHHPQQPTPRQHLIKYIFCAIKHPARRQLATHGGQIEGTLFLRTLCMVAVQVYFTKAGASQGDTLLAANSLLLQFYMLCSYFLDGFAYAGEAVGGKFFGARDRTSFLHLTYNLFYWGTAIAFAFTISYYLGGSYFLTLLTDDPTVRQAALPYLPFASIIPLCGLATFLYDGLYIGTTSTRLMLASVGAGMCVFFIVQQIPIDLWSRNHSLWLAMLAFLTTRGIIQALFFRHILPR